MFQQDKDQVSENSSDDYPFRNPTNGNSNSEWGENKKELKLNPRRGIIMKLQVSRNVESDECWS